jgi:hypothetical protein
MFTTYLSHNITIFEDLNIMKLQHCDSIIQSLVINMLTFGDTALALVITMNISYQNSGSIKVTTYSD